MSDNAEQYDSSFERHILCWRDPYPALSRMDGVTVHVFVQGNEDQIHRLTDTLETINNNTVSIMLTWESLQDEAYMGLVKAITVGRQQILDFLAITDLSTPPLRIIADGNPRIWSNDLPRYLQGILIRYVKDSQNDHQWRMLMSIKPYMASRERIHEAVNRKKQEKKILLIASKHQYLSCHATGLTSFSLENQSPQQYQKMIGEAASLDTVVALISHKEDYENKKWTDTVKDIFSMKAKTYKRFGSSRLRYLMKQSLCTFHFGNPKKCQKSLHLMYRHYDIIPQYVNICTSRRHYDKFTDLLVSIMKRKYDKYVNDLINGRYS